jgi:pectinesterase
LILKNTCFSYDQIFLSNIKLACVVTIIFLIFDILNVSLVQFSGINFLLYVWACAAVDAVGFIAYNISFKNAVGPEIEMAVALRSDSDLSIFYQYEISGYQDSLYPHANRQFYRDCLIACSVDFICGNAMAVFQRCQILVKQGTPGQNTNTITAQSQKYMNESTRFSFQFCNF